MLAVFLLGLLLLSIPSAKRGLYLLPLFPAFAVVMGWWLGRAGEAGAGRMLLDRVTLLLAASPVSPPGGWGRSVVQARGLFQRGQAPRKRAKNGRCP
ncbi:MAG: hypothetical protein HY721_17955 [Planctomycetes bacterium]|nr:hypothetical protein [Planctomycetota bacterium]